MMMLTLPFALLFLIASNVSVTVQSTAFSLPSSFDEHLFQQKIQSTLSRVRKVLSNEKQPLLAPAADVPHEYTDKYLLTELLGNIAISSTSITMESLGLTHDMLRTLLTWVNDKEVYLKFTLDPTCVYNREETKEVTGDKYVEEERGLFGQKTTTKHMVHKVTEYFWDFHLSFSLQACTGGIAKEQCLDLLQEKSTQELVTTSDSRTHSPVGHLERSVKEVNISPYLRHLDASSLLASFNIDRNASACLTPSRNPQIAELAEQFQELFLFSRTISGQLQTLYTYSRQKNFVTSLFSGNAEEVFTPIIPLLDFYDRDDDDDDDEGGTGDMAGKSEHTKQSRSRLLSPSSLNALLIEEEASLRAKLDKFTGVDSESPRDIISSRGAQTLLSLHHLSDIATALHSSVMYMEQMMRSQLLAAIGREVSAQDVAEYSHFYSQKLFPAAVSPAPLAHAVRRSAQHSPEGIFSIEQTFSSVPMPLYTLSREVSSASSQMSFPLDASTRIQFSGEQFVHAYLNPSFSAPPTSYKDKDEPKLSFVASARQFSSFVLLLGKISSQSTFEPVHAVVVRDKDEVRAALKLAVIPTQKEFRDAVQSLSRNQQAFASAFRSMQLEGSLFGAVVVQIKPQLEKVLNLPPQALQQEIELTADLMELFMEHQIPTDLLMATPPVPTSLLEAGGNSSEGSGGSAVERVRANVRAIQGMIARSKEKELKHKKQFDEYHNVGTKGPGSAREEILLGDFEEMDSGPARTRTRGGRQYMKTMKAASSGSVSLSGGRGDVATDGISSMAMPQMASASFSAPEESMDMNSMSDARPPPTQPSQSQAQQPDSPSSTASQSSAGDGQGQGGGFDYTSLPQRLQDAFEKQGGGDILRPTIVTVDDNSWKKESQKNIFSPRTLTSVSLSDQQRNKQQAMYLLDALTRSGALPVTHASLHVLVAATHVFDRSVLETLVQRDVNPLHRLEQSLLVMLQTLHEKPLTELVAPGALEGLTAQHPHLFHTATPSVLAGTRGSSSAATGTASGAGAAMSTGEAKGSSASSEGVHDMEKEKYEGMGA